MRDRAKEAAAACKVVSKLTRTIKKPELLKDTREGFDHWAGPPVVAKGDTEPKNVKNAEHDCAKTHPDMTHEMWAEVEKKKKQEKKAYSADEWKTLALLAALGGGSGAAVGGIANALSGDSVGRGMLTGGLTGLGASAGVMPGLIGTAMLGEKYIDPLPYEQRPSPFDSIVGMAAGGALGAGAGGLGGYGLAQALQGDEEEEKTGSAQRCLELGRGGYLAKSAATPSVTDPVDQARGKLRNRNRRSTWGAASSNQPFAGDPGFLREGPKFTGDPGFLREGPKFTGDPGFLREGQQPAGERMMRRGREEERARRKHRRSQESSPLELPDAATRKAIQEAGGDASRFTPTPPTWEAQRERRIPRSSSPGQPNRATINPISTTTGGGIDTAGLDAGVNRSMGRYDTLPAVRATSGDIPAGVDISTEIPGISPGTGSAFQPAYPGHGFPGATPPPGFGTSGPTAFDPNNPAHGNQNPLNPNASNPALNPNFTQQTGGPLPGMKNKSPRAVSQFSSGKRGASAKSAQERTYASPQEYFELRGNRRLRPPGAPHLRTFSDFMKDIATGGLHGREKARARKLKQQELRDKTRRMLPYAQPQDWHMLLPRPAKPTQPAKPPRPVAPPEGPNFRSTGAADGVGKSAAMELAEPGSSTRSVRAANRRNARLLEEEGKLKRRKKKSRKSKKKKKPAYEGVDSKMASIQYNGDLLKYADTLLDKWANVERVKQLQEQGLSREEAIREAYPERDDNREVASPGESVSVSALLDRKALEDSVMSFMERKYGMKLKEKQARTAYSSRTGGLRRGLPKRTPAPATPPEKESALSAGRRRRIKTLEQGVPGLDLGPNPTDEALAAAQQDWFKENAKRKQRKGIKPRPRMSDSRLNSYARRANRRTAEKMTTASPEYQAKLQRRMDIRQRMIDDRNARTQQASAAQDPRYQAELAQVQPSAAARQMTGGRRQPSGSRVPGAPAGPEGGWIEDMPKPVEPEGYGFRSEGQQQQPTPAASGSGGAPTPSEYGEGYDPSWAEDTSPQPPIDPTHQYPLGRENQPIASLTDAQLAKRIAAAQDSRRRRDAIKNQREETYGPGFPEEVADSYKDQETPAIPPATGTTTPQPGGSSAGRAMTAARAGQMFRQGRTNSPFHHSNDPGLMFRQGRTNSPFHHSNQPVPPPSVGKPGDPVSRGTKSPFHYSNQPVPPPSVGKPGDPVSRGTKSPHHYSNQPPSVGKPGDPVSRGTKSLHHYSNKPGYVPPKLPWWQNINPFNWGS